MTSSDRRDAATYRRILELVKNGPDYENGPQTLRYRVIGFWLHWRTWATMTVLGGSLTLAFFAGDWFELPTALLAAWGSGYIGRGWMTTLSS